jgi:ABC-2 type transport system permease protein
VTALIRAEVRKLSSTQVWFWLLLASLALTAVGVVGQIAGSGDAELAGRTRDVFTAAGGADIAVFVLGILAVTTEFRYQTITPTLLATPSRWRVVTAKLITYLVVGAIYGIVCIALSLAIGLPWLAARSIDVSVGDYLGAMGAVLAVVALYGLVGMGAGALMKNQIVAVSVGLLVLLVLQNLVVIIPGVKYVYPYLPAGAASAITVSRRADRVINDVHLLPVWGGVVVLVAWGIGLAVLGAGITMRRDIT